MDNNEEIKIQTAGERAMALIKDEVELEKLKEELALFEKEKKELEETIHNRNKEIYELNERIILLEYKASLGDASKDEGENSILKDIQGQVTDLRSKARLSRASLAKLRDCLTALKADRRLEEIRRGQLEAEAEDELGAQIEAGLRLVAQLEELAQEEDESGEEEPRKSGNLSAPVITAAKAGEGMRSLLGEISIIKPGGGLLSLDNSINNDMSLFPQEDEKNESSSFSAPQEKTAATTLDLELF